MKNLLLGALMVVILSSCQEKKKVIPTSNGRLSVRFIDKNNDIKQPYTHYKNATVTFNVPSTGTKSFNPTAIEIKGQQDNQNKFETNIALATRYNAFTNLPEYDDVGVYSVSCREGEEITLEIITSLPSVSTITKNDADSLGGTFRVSLGKITGNSFTPYTEMEGYFCIAKNGIL